MSDYPLVGMPWLKPKPYPLACYDCHLRYGDPGWMDAVVENDVWVKISPTGDEGGILCISCMARRCMALDIETQVFIGSGPFCQDYRTSALSANMDQQRDERP